MAVLGIIGLNPQKINGRNIGLMNEGIYEQDNDFVIDMERDGEEDIICTTTPKIYISKFQSNEYYFGYKFSNESSSADRTKFIKWLKQLKLNEVTSEIESFILKPIINLDKLLGIETFDAIIAPKSNRSELVHIIKWIINNYVQRDTLKRSYELVKSIPKDIRFDWETFYSDNEGVLDTNSLKQIENYVNNELMPKIHGSEYFSIAQNVKPKYRKYISNYLKWGENTADIVERIKKGKILVIDDINTTGSTLSEVLRTIRSINKDCEVYVFTLIGK